MDFLIWIGAAISATGLGGLLWCIARVWRARKSDLSEEALRAELQRVVPVNTGALLLSVLGLMVVVLGIVFSG